MSHYSHIPVLLQEVLHLTNPESGDIVFDATLGGAGYTQALARVVGPKGKVYATDLDSSAIENARVVLHKSLSSRVELVHSGFDHIDQVARKHKLPGFNVIVADLGLSSFQLDASSRGFSFQKDEPLDMRFDSNSPDKASDILAMWPEEKLTKIFRDFGEDKNSSRIARAIVTQRQMAPLKFTQDLVTCIKSALPKTLPPRVYRDTNARIFQALRIATNSELERLESFLVKALELLVPGGRMAVVSFHSLEDRLVKRSFAAAARGCICPPDFPMCVCGREPQVLLLTKKPVTAGPEEVSVNSRSQSAKLRAVQKL